MKIGIIGFPQTGKKTVFELLTGHKPTENEIASGKPINGIMEIDDPRFDKLVSIYKPQKQVKARIGIELFPDIEKDAIAKGDIFKDIGEVNSICHIVRAFKNETVYHVSGSVDPKRDIDSVNAELILNDLLFIEKRVERIDLAFKKLGNKAPLDEKGPLLKLKAHLDKELPLRLLPLSGEEEKMIASYPLITRKAMLLLLNVSEDEINNTAITDKLKKDYEALRMDIIQISAKVESEISALEQEGEKEEFLKSLGISEPAIHQVGGLYIKALGLISFFTVGPDEVRQWLIRSGTYAPEAAGTIHTDMEKGFIRAEVIKYADLMAYGSEEKVKEAGRVYLKGKDYIVEDGDIMDIRFNV